jgi:hypothetical protein
MQSQAAATVRHAPARGALVYARRQPETTLLYQILQEHWLGFRAAIETDGRELPAFVCDEFEAYFRCGILAHGFRCNDCGYSRVVGFSCKRRCFCPSCLGRRMADTAAFCVEHLLPRVPVRQWILSVPYRLRFQMAYSLECPKCKGRRKILAVVSAPASVHRILKHRGLPTEARRLHSARPPPQMELDQACAAANELYPDPPCPDW